MTKQEVFELANKNPSFQLATVDGDKPQTRGMLLFRADENGIIFHTGTFKSVYGQMIANPNVQLCFFDPVQNIQVRISGTVQQIEDRALFDEVVNHPSRAFLQGWRQNDPNFDNSLKIFRMTDGAATTWTFQSNFDPKTEIPLF